IKMQISQKTSRRGLYDPRFEHDACGIGFVARLSGEPSHEIVRMALTAVGNMAHRGGVAVLWRPDRLRLHQRARSLPSALFDQHVSKLAECSAIPYGFA